MRERELAGRGHAVRPPVRFRPALSHAHCEDSVSPPLAEDLRAACEGLAADPRRACVIVDVDEVLALFVQGFRAWLEARGYELRMETFRLFGAMYARGMEEPLEREAARGLFDRFFTDGCADLPVTPDAVDALARLARRAQVVILTAAPPQARSGRQAWLTAHALPYALVFSDGLKGASVRALQAAVGGPCAFVDDLLPNLDSVAVDAPEVARFQLVADPLLRAIAPSAPERHRRIDGWPELALAIEAALFPGD